MKGRGRESKIRNHYLAACLKRPKKRRKLQRRCWDDACVVCVSPWHASHMTRSISAEAFRPKKERKESGMKKKSRVYVFAQLLNGTFAFLRSQWGGFGYGLFTDIRTYDVASYLAFPSPMTAIRTTWSLLHAHICMNARMACRRMMNRLWHR